MAGKITALFLAILVANPFCCCFAVEAEGPVGEEAHACCPVAMAAMAALADAEDSAPEGSDPCECSDERRSDSALLAVEKPIIPQWFLLSQITWDVLPGAEARVEVLRGMGDLPDAVKPPGRALSRVHCAYLL